MFLSRFQLQSSSSDSLEYIVDGQIRALDLKVIGDEAIDDLNELVNSIIDFRPQGEFSRFKILNISHNGALTTTVKLRFELLQSLANALNFLKFVDVFSRHHVLKHKND